jgi:hypothetical protein
MKPKFIAILNAETGKVHIVAHLEENAEDAYEAWLEENGAGDSNCQWMECEGSVQFQRLGDAE